MRVLVTGSEGGFGQAVAAELGFTSAHELTLLDPWAGLESRHFDGVFDSPPEEWSPRLDGGNAQLLGLFDAVVVCHGINAPGRRPPYRPLWEANYFSVVNLMDEWERARLPVAELTSRRSLFIVVTSNSADIPRSKSRDYCASKAAIDMALRCAQRDHAAQGFEYYSLAAGHANTPMFEYMSKELGADVMRAGYERSPLKALMEPHELAELVAFILEKPSARWLSGSTLRLDGGEH